MRFNCYYFPMQFVVPQFIEVESKVLGPITVRQFVQLVIAGLLIVISYKLADFSLFLLEAVLIGITTLIFAFVKINGRPFHYFLINFLETAKFPKKKTWNKFYGKEQLFKIQTASAAAANGAKVMKVVKKQPVAHSRLSELSLLVDTGGYYHQK